MSAKNETFVTDSAVQRSDRPDSYDDVDPFGHEEGNTIQYKTMSWQLVALLLITEICSNGTLSLPSSLAAVGIVRGLIIIIIFLGIFATYTSWLLIKFKLRHPQVHTMGDAGYIMFGPIGREVLAFGTVLFAIFALGGQILAGQLALSALSDNALCATLFAAIYTIATIVCSFPRTLDSLSWLGIPAAISILIAGVVGMIGAGLHPVEGRQVDVVVPADFYSAFISITNPVFAYAGHFTFFTIISEMRRPQDAMKAAYALQTFATTFYSVFAVVVYVYIGNSVLSPALSSLESTWQKASYGIILPNLLIAGSLCAHVAAKLFFVRIFKGTKHVQSHTALGWIVWTALILFINVAAFLLAIGVPIFNYLIGIAASLFAAWYTYGLAGAFWLHDSYYDQGGYIAWRRKPVMFITNVLTVLAGAFICVAGTYVTCDAIAQAYAEGLVARPFSC